MTGSGPKGEASTFSYAVNGSDYLSAYLILYVNGVKKDEDNVHDHDTNQVNAYVEHLYYAAHGGVILPCRGETTHKVIDSENGWDDTFNTSDHF